jgi:hypothetical protein
MENFKQIIYRDSDTALMILPLNDEIQIIPRFVNELTEEQKISFDDLKNFCLTKVSSLDYVVYTLDVNRLDIQATDNSVVCLMVSELDTKDKEIVQKVGLICTELLNT